MRHIPVLLNEVVTALALRPGENVIDCTLGDAGHAEKILEKTAPGGKLLGIDADPESLLRAKQFLYAYGERVMYVRENFSHLKDIVDREKFGPVNAILLDLGWSSPQFEERGRGFSFLKPEEPLDMRYTVSGEMKTAADLLAQETESDLEKIFREYGEEKFSTEIAHAIVTERHAAPFQTVAQLIEVILEVYRKRLHSEKEVPWIGGVHPATKVFQALRIAVNDELGVVRSVLPQAVDVLASGGRLAVITFHSLEDRIVKHFFKSQEQISIRVITKKAVQCSPEEHEANPRARSAKLRVIEKL